MLELLTRLADKSLVRVEHAGGDSRYHLLVTIRDYARDRLAEAGEADAIRQAHLAYFTELVEAAAGRIEGDQAGATAWSSSSTGWTPSCRGSVWTPGFTSVRGHAPRSVRMK